jgi:hypothetical protein
MQLLKKGGIERWRFDEQQLIAATKFRFKENEKPVDYVLQLSSSMQVSAVARPFASNRVSSLAFVPFFALLDDRRVCCVSLRSCPIGLFGASLRICSFSVLVTVCYFYIKILFFLCSLWYFSCCLLQELPPQHFLTGGSLYFRWDPALIQRTLDTLTVDECK